MFMCVSMHDDPVFCFVYKFHMKINTTLIKFEIGCWNRYSENKYLYFLPNVFYKNIVTRERMATAPIIKKMLNIKQVFFLEMPVYVRWHMF